MPKHDSISTRNLKQTRFNHFKHNWGTEEIKVYRKVKQ